MLIPIRGVAGCTSPSYEGGSPSVGHSDWRHAVFAWRCPGRRCLRRGEGTDWSAHTASARRRGGVTRSSRTDWQRRARLHHGPEELAMGHAMPRRWAGRPRHACRSGCVCFHTFASFPSPAVAGAPRRVRLPNTAVCRGGSGAEKRRQRFCVTVSAQHRPGAHTLKTMVGLGVSQKTGVGAARSPLPTADADRPVSTAPECWQHPIVTAPWCVGRGRCSRAGRRAPRGGRRRLPHTRPPQMPAAKGVTILVAAHSPPELPIAVGQSGLVVRPPSRCRPPPAAGGREPGGRGRGRQGRA